MPVIAAAVCPHPPMLVPEVASGAASELDDLRAACAEAVDHLVAARPDRIIVIGSGPTPSGAEIGRPDLPLSLAIGEWLLGPRGHQRQVVGIDASAHECIAAGRVVASSADRVALLVMGDGSACRGPQAPGYDDPRAEGFDRAVADALARADAQALLALDPVLARELRCAGRAPWQVLSGALGAADPTDGAPGAADPTEGAPGAAAAADSMGTAGGNGKANGHWRGELRYDRAPYGVAYFVAIMKLTS